jgi:biopolymer transport protein ExbB
VFSIIQAAGWPIWPLLLCSVVALALVIERFAFLRGSRIAPAALVDEVLGVTRAGLPSPEVTERLAQSSLLGEVLASGLRAAAQPQADAEQLRQALESAGRQAVHRMERSLSALGTIATAAPLLGLLGTVVGMIEIFAAQAPAAATAGSALIGGGIGSANPQQLAHGISIALYNTAFGLIVAIPALMCYRHFRDRVDAHTLTLELASQRLMGHLLQLAGQTPPGVTASTQRVGAAQP